MKNFLKDFLFEPFREREYFIGIFAWIITLIIVVPTVWFSLWLIDSSFLPQKDAVGAVVSKEIIPEHTTTTYTMCGKVMIPITNHYDTEWVINIDINGLTDDYHVYESIYDEIKIGDKIPCKYTNGRIFNSLYIQEITVKW